MAGLQLSGLASGFDWKSVVDQLMAIEQAPITRLEQEQLSNTLRSNALNELGTKLSALQSAAQGLGDASLFSSRTATSSAGSTWVPAASSGATAGSYKIAVSQLATKASRQGAGDITGGISATGDVSGVTLATMRTAAVVTSGTFTVNGAQVAVATTDSLQDVFDAISSATGGDVTASYDAGTDKITLQSASLGEIVLGAANDTSNFLAVLKLVNNGTDTVASYGTLGSIRTGATLAAAGLNTAITAVDGSGSGSFTINGVAIDYNVNTDTLAQVVKRINASGAGVTAAYDALNDRVTLANNATGDLGMTLGESAGGLLGALGLASGYTTTRGKNAEFTIDDGPTIVSNSNTLSESLHGIAGLAVTVDSETTETITVAADKDAMKEKIDAFVTAYNAVQTYIDDKTKITTSNGKVSTAVLASNREVQEWSRSLRTLAFGAVSGLAGTIDRLDDLGIGFDKDGVLSVEDADKLDEALDSVPADVEEFFSDTANGLANRFDDLLDNLIGLDDDSRERLTNANSDIDEQIAAIERRLTQQRELLTNSFIAMETAQSKIQQQSTAISNAFPTTSSSS